MQSRGGGDIDGGEHRCRFVADRAVSDALLLRRLVKVKEK
jgi:hypothetical protein